MKRYKFDLGGSYVLYWGDTMGEAIAVFLKHRANRVEEIVAITELPLKAHELP